MTTRKHLPIGIQIDQLIELNQQTIDKLKEYQTALITVAVTGKIDVSNWQQEANHATR